MFVSFGNFASVCASVAFPLCSLVGPQPSGYSPTCYARNVDIAGFLLLQPGTLIILLAAIVMTLIMIASVKSKYTAVGRKEFALFLYLYLALCILELLLEGNIISMSLSAYPYFAAIHIGLINAVFWCLLLNGFIGFQFAEDGTPVSLWSFRISSLLVALVGFLVAILTFNGTPGSIFSPTSQIPLWIFVYILPGGMLLVYVILQVILVVNTLDDRWPLGDLIFGLVFFILGQVFMLILSPYICSATTHYVDGLFFGTMCTLLSVMMVYKFWDSITKEDLEFSVGGKLNVWEVKEDFAPPQQQFKVFGYQPVMTSDIEGMMGGGEWDAGVPMQHSRSGSYVGGVEGEWPRFTT